MKNHWPTIRLFLFTDAGVFPLTNRNGPRCESTWRWAVLFSLMRFAHQKSLRIRSELKWPRFLGQDILKPIPDGHEIWVDDKYGAPLTNLKLRIKKPEGGFPDDPPTIAAPKMDGVALDGRLVVLFSPYDLSCAMENKAVSDCSGYTRKDATAIARRIVLYSLLSDSKPNR